jgi:hypothetical protein
LSRTRQLGILLAVILVIACIYLGTGYLKQVNKHEALSSRLHDLSQTISLIPAPSPDMEKRLSEAQRVYDTARQVIPANKANSTQVIANILDLGVEYQIKIIPILTDEWTTKTIEGNQYNILKIKLNTRSSFDNLAKFIRRLDSNEFPSLAIDAVNISVDSEQDQGVSIAAVFELALFAQKED